MAKAQKKASREIKMRGKVSFLLSDWSIFPTRSQHARRLNRSGWLVGYVICDSNMAASLSFGTLTNFGDKTSNNSDSWQDANTALAELDKGELVKLPKFHKM